MFKVWCLVGRKKNTFSYAPGQEIRFSSGSFGWETEDESVNVCKRRILTIIGLFLLIYFIIIVRIFNVCLVNGISFEKEKITYYRPKRGIIVPVHRANITDRNGVVVATNLPTVNLFTNPQKVSNANEIAKIAQIASALEVSGYPKPGNVHRTRDYDDMEFEDFGLRIIRPTY